MGETQSRHAYSTNESQRHSATKEVRSGDAAFAGVLSRILPTLSSSRTRCDAAAPPPPPVPGDAPNAASSSAPAVEAPPPVDSIEAAAQLASAFTNPGPYEQAMSDGKRLVNLDTFDGFRCDINKQVSPFMLAAHSFHLGTTMFPDGRKSSYAFLAQVADEQGIIMARIDPSRGSLDGRIHKALLGGAAMAKLQMGVSQEGGQNDSCMAELDVFGHTWSGNLKYGSMGGGLVYGLNYIQAVHPNVSLGGEGMYISANQNLVASYGLKVNWQSRPADVTNLTTPPPPPPPGMPQPETAGNSVLCLNYNSGQMTVTANFKRCIAPNRLALGAELQFSPLSLESQVLMGAEYKWQRSKMSLCVDGSGRIQSVLEAKYGMAPGSPSLMLSAEMDHANDAMKFGYGINIES